MLEELRLIEGPGGRVAWTAAPFRDADLKDILGGLLPEPEAYDYRVVLFGDVDRDPISYLWRMPWAFWAGCLPRAFERVMIEVPHLAPEQRAYPFYSVHSNSIVVRKVTPSRPSEPDEFLPKLAPQQQVANPELRETIRYVCGTIYPRGAANIALEAGLLLMNDCLDESHSCSQSIEGEGQFRNGDYWHALMHRREPDYGNAKYWFRRVGKHPILKQLPKYAMAAISRRGTSDLESLSSGEWDPLRFVDFCEKYAGDEESPEALTLREIQGWEMATLFRCFEPTIVVGGSQ